MFEEMKFSAAENLKLPKDVVLGEVLVSFLGRHSVVIEITAASFSIQIP